MKSNYFNLGTLVQTRKICKTRRNSPIFMQEVQKSLEKHCNKDWGVLDEEDAALNNQAVEQGVGRIFSAYETSEGKIWIITEADRSVTTILFPHEY